ILKGVDGNPSTITGSQGLRGVSLEYNTDPGDFVGAGFAYDDFGTNSIETFDLSGLTDLSFGIRGDEGTVKFQIIDGQDQKAEVLLTGVSSAIEKVWTINIAQYIAGKIDLTDVRVMYFIVEGAGKQGVLEVNRLAGAPIINVQGPIEPSDDLTEADTTVLPDNPTTEAESAINRISSELTDLLYDVSGVEDHSTLIVRFDDPETPFVIESSDLSALGQLVVGVSATGTRLLQVEVLDAAGTRTIQTLTQIGEGEQFYAIDFSNPNAPVDLTQIQAIRFSVERRFVNEATGIVHLRLKGLDTTAPALTPELEAARRQIIAEQLQYFQMGVGVDPDTHLPFDQIENGVTRKFTTLTDIGFYLQILGEVVRGSLDNGMSRDTVLEELQIILNRLLNMQANDGTGGLLPVVYDMPPTLPEFGPSPTFPFIAFGDNANLSQSIAVVVGILESIDTLSQAQVQAAADVIRAADAFLDNQEDGYTQFYDGNAGKFRMTYNTDTDSFDGGFIDRLANEFHSGIAFVVVRYQLPEAAWGNLEVRTKVYTDQFGQDVTNLVPFDGGAFQMFWPLLWSNEAGHESMQAALQNFLYTAADFSNRNGLPGFLSASSVPEGGYQGKIGIPDAAETNEPILSNVASIYALASAYVLNPTLVVTWLNAIFEQYPELVTELGFVDALRSASEFSDVFNAIDQGSSILGLLGSGGDFMERYLENRNLDDAYQALYDNLGLNIQAIGEDPAGPPAEFPSKSFAVMSNIELEGSLGDSPCVNPGCADATVFGTPIRYNGLDNSTLAGHFWKLDQNYDARDQYLAISLSGSIPEGELGDRVEFKDENDQLIDAITDDNVNDLVVDAYGDPATGVGTIIFDLSRLSAAGLSGVRFVNLVFDPSGDPDADFFVHQISFVQFPSQVQALFAVVSSPQAASDINAAINSALNFNVLQLQTQGRLAFATVETNFDFSAEKVVFGFKSSKALKKIAVELEDETGAKARGYVTGVNTTEHYYEFLKDFVPAGVDLSRIRKINIMIDSTAVEGGSSPSTAFDDLTVEMSLV
ncbi:MAG: hypothetical protein HY588_00300, partial [Candidatus Omnitrophica bacterium]|nr:hypothetical protein [Candidatus Omnitrophota bacterium]